MSNYNTQAREDACDMAEEFLDQIVEQVLADGKASDDYNNDHAGGDEYHHQNHVDHAYSFQEAAKIVSELDDDEETDSGLWQGLDMKEAMCACAAYTYGNAVTRHWRRIIEDINDDADVEHIKGLITDLDAVDPDDLDTPLPVYLQDLMGDLYDDEDTIENARATCEAHLKQAVQDVIKGYRN